MTTATHAAAAPAPSSLWSRVYGYGSVFGKTLRDSRRAMLITAILLGLVFIAVSAAIVAEFDTAESRRELEAIVAAVPPILQGLAGPVVNVGTLGGYLQYKYGTFFPLVVSLWSILALSATLAGEARRGSLEFVLAAPESRTRVALQKISGHIVALLLTMLVVFLAIAIAGSAFPVLPGDEISVASAFGYAAWLGLLALAGGSLAFALAQFIGRGAAAGIAGAVVFGGFILNGYQAAVPALAPLANLTWFGWTAHHVALAGVYDWAAVALVAAFVVAMLGIGIWAFARRDIGATTNVPTPSLPRTLTGLGGPLSRTVGFGLSPAIAWGVGLGLFGFLLAASGDDFIDQLRNTPSFVQLLETVFPGVDFASVGGFLQLLFIEFGLVLAGLAGATLVGGWASEETSGRLEMLFAAPVARVRWVISSGIGMLVNVAVIVVIAALGIAIGALLAGGDIGAPALGTAVLGVYAAATIGIGVAFGGVLGTRWAAAAVVVFTILTWFVQLLGPLLGLPEVVLNLALTSHFGQPMVGVWDWTGIVASIAIAVGGILIGAWGFKRRDLLR